MSDCILRETFYKDTIEFGLVKIECMWFMEILQQIIYFLVVDLQEGTIHFEFKVGSIFIYLDIVEELVDGSRDDACEVLVSGEVLEKGVLLFLVLVVLEVLGDVLLPIAAEHGVGFSRARLAIGEDSHVVALWDFGEGGGKFGEDILLRFVLGEGMI
jgi:hypothetical protein